MSAGVNRHPYVGSVGKKKKRMFGRGAMFVLCLVFAVLFVTILSLINSFKVFREVYLLTGDYPYEKLYMLQHFMNNTFRSLDYQKLSAAAVVMALVMVVLIALMFKVEDWFGKDVEG